MLGLVLLLGVAIALLAHTWWLPPAASHYLKQFVEGEGVTQEALRLTELDLDGLRLGWESLERDGVRVEGGSLEVDYSLDGLRRRRLESILVEEPRILVNWPELRSVLAKPDAEPGEARTPLALPLDYLPFGWLALEGAEILLTDATFERSMRGSLWVMSGSPDRMLTHWESAGDELSLSGTFDLATPSLDLTYRLVSPDPFGWLEDAEALGLFTLPPEGVASSGPLQLEGALKGGDVSWQWLGMATWRAIDMAWGEQALQIAHLHAGGRGEGRQPDRLWAAMDGIEARASGHMLEVQELTLETLDRKQVFLRVEPCRILAMTPWPALGELRFELPAFQALLRGPWADPEHVADVDAYALAWEVPAARFAIQSALLDVNGQLAGSANVGASASRVIHAELKGQDVSLQASAGSGTIGQLKLGLEGTYPGGLSAQLGLQGGQFSWAEGAGSLTGLHGTLELPSLLPFLAPGLQTLTFDRVAQGDLVAHSGRLTLEYLPAASSQPAALHLELEAETFGGTLMALVQATLGATPSVAAELVLDNVQLEQLAELFPEFNGSIQGRVSGRLPIRIEGPRIFLQPGYLEMAPGQTGHFRYEQPGWLTQDPGLDPVQYAQSRDLVTLLQEPDGAAILTELAMRDLRMTAFRLDLLKPGAGDRKVLIQIEGDGRAKGVKVPVVQEIRVGGDLKETLNLLLQMQNRVAF